MGRGKIRTTKAAVRKPGGVVVVGKGQGGKVGKPSKKNSPLKVFISYSHKDEELKNEFESHLRPLVRRDLIQIWSDRKIAAGDEWKDGIISSLENADIILLLVSVDFVNSDFCYEKELEIAMERHDRQDAIVIPVILRNCMWKSTLFAKLQGVPKDGKPVTSWPTRDDAFVDAAQAIEKSAEALRARRQ